MKRREIENYLFDKEVLKAYCNASSLTFNEVDFDAYVTHIDGQNLKDEIARIRKFCGITTSLNPEIFKRQLSLHVREGTSVFCELEDCIFNQAI